MLDATGNGLGDGSAVLVLLSDKRQGEVDARGDLFRGQIGRGDIE
jgi:hypothetical protein